MSIYRSITLCLIGLVIREGKPSTQSANKVGIAKKNAITDTLKRVSETYETVGSGY